MSAQPTQPQNPERGLDNHRIDFVREQKFGVTPADPAFKAFSHTLNNFSAAGGATIEARRGLSDAAPKDHDRGPESHELTVAYDMVKWFTQNGGEAYDAAYDGLVMNSHQLLPNSHTIVGREDKGVISAAATVNARLEGENGNAGDGSNSTARETRIYSVARGALVNEATIGGDPSDSQPVTTELGYMAQYLRSYKFDQPTGSTTLAVASTEAGDTVDVTIESEGAGTAETVTLSGTTTVGTASTFGDIDAVSLSAETQGDVIVSVNAGTETTPEAGEALAVINGASSYQDVEGDLGVPALGAGSREAATESNLGQPERFIGDRVLRANQPYPHEFQSVSLTVSNNVETQTRNSRYGHALYPGTQEIQFEASIFGEGATHDLLRDHLENVHRDMAWAMAGGNLELARTALTEPGERAPEAEQAVMTTDNTFSATDITFTEA